MTSFERGRAVLEGGWVLSGQAGDGSAVKLILGETELSRAYLGATIGRHPRHQPITQGEGNPHGRAVLRRGR